MTETSTNSLKVGAAQVAEVYLDKDATVQKDVEYIRKAGELDLDLLVFPETHIPGNPIWSQFDSDRSIEDFYQELFRNAVEIPGPAIERLSKAANSANITVVMGVNERERDTAGTMYNTTVVIDSDGSIVGKRRKLTPTLTERIYHTGGTGEDVRTFDTSVGELGSLLCSEHHNPLSIFATLAAGEEIHAAQWPCFAWCDTDWIDRRVGVRSQYHALAGNVPTVIATGVVDEALHDAIGSSSLSTGAGHSAILSPEGEYLTSIAEGEGIVHTEIDLEERTWSKAVHDIVGHYNRFDIFTLEIDRSPQEQVRNINASDQQNRTSEQADGYSRIDDEAVECIIEAVQEETGCDLTRISTERILETANQSQQDQDIS